MHVVDQMLWRNQWTPVKRTGLGRCTCLPNDCAASVACSWSTTWRCIWLLVQKRSLNEAPELPSCHAGHDRWCQACSSKGEGGAGAVRPRGIPALQEVSGAPVFAATTHMHVQGRRRRRTGCMGSAPWHSCEGEDCVKLWGFSAWSVA